MPKSGAIANTPRVATVAPIAAARTATAEGHKPDV